MCPAKIRQVPHVQLVEKLVEAPFLAGIARRWLALNQASCGLMTSYSKDRRERRAPLNGVERSDCPTCLRAQRLGGAQGGDPRAASPRPEASAARVASSLAAASLPGSSVECKCKMGLICSAAC